MGVPRHLWLVLLLIAACGDVANRLDLAVGTVSVARDSGPDDDGGAGTADGGRFDAGAADGGAVDGGPGPDAGASDAGPTDGGAGDGGAKADGGAAQDAGVLDGGSDGGSSDAGPACVCGVWEVCDRDAGSAQCVSLELEWLSPAVGVPVPGDLMVLPLGLQTNAPLERDVPWWSSGAVNAQGTFSGPPGIRSAQLLLPESDGGLVTLFAGWDGGPIAQRSLVLGAPALQLSAMPARGPNTADFEPNDPVGVAWRRDENVRVSVSDLPTPIGVFARAATSLQTWSTLAVPCDAGGCWETTLGLAEVDFPTFRGEVLVWATGADGGLQTRPRSLPVTRWHWRRHIAGVPVPLRITQPRVPEWGPFSFVVAGTEDTRTTGRLVTLTAGGQPIMRLLSTTHAVLDIETVGWVVATVRTDAGVRLERLDSATAPRPLPTGDVQMRVSGYDRTLVFWDGGFVASPGNPLLNPMAVPGPYPTGCSSDAGFEQAFVHDDLVLFSNGQRACRFNPFGGAPTGVMQTQREYRPTFSFNMRATNSTGRMLAAGADGGVYALLEGPAFSTMALSERPLWAGGLVDWFVEFESTAFWTTHDGHIWRYENTDAGLTQFSDSLPRRLAVSPVLLPAHTFTPDEAQLGSLIAVDEANAVHAFKTDTGRRLWSVQAGDGGIRGGRVDSHPITVTRCVGLDTILIPSAGDGSLYSFITDEKARELRQGRYSERAWAWFMWNAAPSGNQVRGSNSIIECVPE